MLIDPSQPIMFDSDSPPGRGAGYWQINPRRSYFSDDELDDSTVSSTPDTKIGRIASRVVFAIVFGGIPLAALHMLLT